MEILNTVIIGSGCSGLTAAIYAARANLKPLVLEGHEPGGQLSLTTLVENFPGFPEGIQGPELIENMRKQAARFGAEYKTAHVYRADLQQASLRPARWAASSHPHRARSSSPAAPRARWLGLPSEQALIGHGVSSCATCDGFFFSGKEITVIGGGDSAMEEAMFLTRFATKVTMIHRRDQFRASKIMLERATAIPRSSSSPTPWSRRCSTRRRRRSPASSCATCKTGTHCDLTRPAPCFSASATSPTPGRSTASSTLDDDGYIKTRDNVFTNIPGVFACGDVQDRRYRQAITAAGTGCMAAMEVEKFLEEQGTVRRSGDSGHRESSPGIGFSPLLNESMYPYVLDGPIINVTRPGNSTVPSASMGTPLHVAGS